MLYLITDTHLGHQNMLKSCGRPARFTNLILENCRKMVRGNDTLIHLGDVAWNEEELMRFMKLPGHKVLVRGNHDKKSTPYYMEAGFDLVVDSMTMTLQGIRVLFSHAPQYGHTADINIHGHQHDLHYEDIFHRYWPLALEHMGYEPLPLDDKTVGVLQSWVKRGRNPSKKELYALHQSYLGTASTRDYIGNTKAAMPKSLCFWTDDGTEHLSAMMMLLASTITRAVSFWPCSAISSSSSSVSRRTPPSSCHGKANACSALPHHRAAGGDCQERE